MNKALKSLLKTAVYAMDEFSNRFDRASDVVSDLSEHGRKLIYREKQPTARTIGAFAAGLGLGIGLGMLFAPASESKLVKKGLAARAANE